MHTKGRLSQDQRRLLLTASANMARLGLVAITMAQCRA
ncbi:hypothetical protein M2272_001430 [Mycobacterium frederiksbergense]|uniref:Transposase n=1 Tax=Mycolicibacterium frederiksbergense TaxID=117567 RepID=A0ABT6KVQ9_9MYCO|nr:hypothetical protein [Mycolicibacterium frederiksbergense]